MCGICGIFRKDGQPAETDLIEKMCRVMVHRGPDDEGIFTKGPIGIGMRRLKIIDLTTGHQPMHNEDETVWVVFNGEIYNYRELISLLENKGHRFYTKSDTEVLVHLYEEYGDGGLSLLNGMFSFAIYDTRTNSLFIARDRLGIKQIYYYEDENIFVFGSEIKTILAYPDISRDINYQALSDYFSFQYIPAPHTIFNSIKKLPPAYSLTIGDSKHKSETRRYWMLSYETPYITGEEAIESTNDVLQTAVQSQMVSDVPLGAYLSGGIDSSLLVAMMANVSSRPVETFSIIWDQGSKTFDERKYSRFIAEKYQTNHHEFLVKPQIEEVMDDIIRAFDEPFADDSAIPNYYIARETRKHVTVALSGLGGDEMSAGYERYLGQKLLHYYHAIPEGIRDGIISKAIQSMPDFQFMGLWVERLKRFSRVSNLSFVESYFKISSKLDKDEKQTLFTPEALRKMGSDYDSVHHFRYYNELCNSHNELDRMLYIDAHTYMVDQLLVLSDRMSMAHSLELRVPYLDHTLVELFARIDPAMKLHGMVKKYLLKKVAEKYFPKNFIYRNKMGFSSPMVIWLRNDLKKFMLHLLNKKDIERTGIIDPDTVNRYVNEHLERKHNHDMKLWSLMMFMIWHKLYINNS